MDNGVNQMLTFSQCFTFLQSYAIKNLYSLAAWRLPNSSRSWILLSKKNQTLNSEFTLEELHAGFIFSPFDPAANKVFLNADYLFSFEDGVIEMPLDKLATNSQEWLIKAMEDYAFKPKVSYYESPSAPNEVSKDLFLTNVAEAIAQIEDGVLEKVVLSRSKVISMTKPFDVYDAFDSLCATYQNALIAFVTSPETGTWLTASPEILVCVKDKITFKTVALAGTQPFQEGQNIKSVAWTQKEIEEQALVERYIISCFKKIRLREYEEHGPKTVIAGNLLHLKSDFTVDLKATNFPNLGSIMLQLLHPTSAICGMPLEQAMKFIVEHEQYDRTYYAGYLGPVNIENDIHVFVNLRCMQLYETQAALYAGAGITADSDPIKEWEETEMKMNTLLTVAL